MIYLFSLKRKLGMSFKFYHQTSPHCAVSIIQKKTFFSCQMLSDNGLNGYLNRRNVNRQTLEGRGAELVLGWYGDVEKVDIDFPVQKMKKNTLYIQEPWRIFIRAEMDLDLLRILNVKYSDKNFVDDYIWYPQKYRRIPFQSCRNSIMRKYKLEEIKSMRIYLKDDYFLKIK